VYLHHDPCICIRAAAEQTPKAHNFLCSNSHSKINRKAQEELAETEGRRATEALEREAAMARKLQSLELQLRAERAGREAAGTQLLKAEDGLGEREAAWEAQRQVCSVVDDVRVCKS
jgi:hypothetical protein